MEESTSEFQVTNVRICIDQKDPQYTGRIYGICLEKELSFSNKDELLWAVGQAYAVIGRPQPALVPRSFDKSGKKYNSYVGNPLKHHTSEYIHEQHGKLETYDLLLSSMKHAEWQGLWRNTDGSFKSEFQTMLQCMEQI